MVSRLSVVVVMLAPLLAGFIFSVGDPARTAFYLEETLFYPHPTQAMVRVIPASTVTLRLRYGATRATMTSFVPDSAGTSVTANTAGEFTITSLTADTTYLYQLEASEDGSWKPRGVHEFKTPPTSTSSTFTFTSTADTHFFVHFAHDTVGGNCQITDDMKRPYPYYDYHYRTLLTMRKIAGQSQLFHVDLGDGFFDCQCATCKGCSAIWPDGSTGAYSISNEASTEAEEQTFCERRIRTTLRYLIPFEASVPLVTVDGNHDGGVKFGSPNGHSILQFNGGSSGQPKRMLQTMRAARNKYLGNANDSSWWPNSGCDGGCTEQDGDYSAFEVGSALFIRLNPFIHTPIGWGTDLDGDTVSAEDPADYFPQNADQWTLGAEQLSWLENQLSTTSKKWIFVLSHMLPGAPSPEFAYGLYHYGKFGAGVERYCEDQPTELCECHAGENCYPPCASGTCDAADLSSTWRGDLDVIFPAAKAAAARVGGAVLFVLGHDHTTYSWQYQDGGGSHPVYVIAHGSPSLTAKSQVTSAGPWRDQHLTGLFPDGHPLPPASDPLWAMPPNTDRLGTSAYGSGKWTVTGETNVKFEYIGNPVGRHDWYTYQPARFVGADLVCLIYTENGYSVCP